VLAAILCCLPADLFISPNPKGLAEPVVVKHRGQGAKRQHGNCVYEPWVEVSLHCFVYNYSDRPVLLEVKRTTRKTLYPGDSVYIMPSVPHRWVHPHRSLGNNSITKGGANNWNCRANDSYHPGTRSNASEPGIRFNLPQTHEEQNSKKLVEGEGVGSNPLTKDPQAQKFRLSQETLARHQRAQCGNLNSAGFTDVMNPRLFEVRIPGNLTRELMMEVSLCDQRGKQRIGRETQRWYN